MKTLVLVAHPHMEQSRINSIWKQRLLQEKDITVNDLYARYPELNIDVEREQRLLLEHDRIVMQFPFYWYSSPAMLKLWQDQVLERGWAYGGGEKLKGKSFMLALSTGGPEHAYGKEGYNVFTISEYTRPFQGMANLTDMTYLPHFALHGVRMLSDEQIKESAERLVQVITDRNNHAKNFEVVFGE
ncbi:glutathione-regulated potassium-efflux system ancillary protein KefG [Paenibacillus taihuensis]|uniref:Glutathione-regulated potassium-efflux system ancillary protein KefG n=1 Tax=Paenibacillus taihuensis TaxID=1156355 RepID=A0A3D9QTW8_9BACL|nr:NAD(P)H-dependent oxidoreductase [Paenibacillus taihuensis]REE66725.1 glutathione-regulated potassium-efflux system ancillary protein KefG [Paenibacillus taihuensis]